MFNRLRTNGLGPLSIANRRKANNDFSKEPPFPGTPSQEYFFSCFTAQATIQFWRLWNLPELIEPLALITSAMNQALTRSTRLRVQYLEDMEEEHPQQDQLFGWAITVENFQQCNIYCFPWPLSTHHLPKQNRMDMSKSLHHAQCRQEEQSLMHDCVVKREIMDIAPAREAMSYKPPMSHGGILYLDLNNNHIYVFDIAERRDRHPDGRKNHSRQ